MRRIFKGGLFLSAAIVAGAAIYCFDPHDKAPSAAALSAPASQYDTEIIRDEWGMPHIYGKTDADAAFGLGYAQAEDDIKTIVDVVIAARGRMARYQGREGAPTDYIVALMDVRGTVERKYQQEVPANVRAMASAYADGMNLYAARHPKEILPGILPFTGEDVIAGFVLKTPFFYGFDGSLLALLDDERKAELSLDPANKQGAWMVGPKTAYKRGSNAMAVTPARSGDGVTRLMINSHQPLTGPVAWYEAHIVSEEGLNMSGANFPGAPIILHGFNDNLGWANTVSEPDLVDTYLLEINPTNANQYKYDGQWKDFETRQARIDVKLFGPFAFPARRTIKRSVHGPVLEAPSGTYAIKYAGMDEIRQLTQYYRLNKARNLDEFMAAMKMNALPSINYIYADAQGNVGFIQNGQYPQRAKGWDWAKDLPGDKPMLNWDSYRPWTEVPQLFNPASGLIFNANNQPFSATDGPDNLLPQNFAPEQGLQRNETNRSLRLIELTDGTAPIDRGALLALKFDNKYSNKSHAAEIVRGVLVHDYSANPRLQAAKAHLAAWDFRTDIGNPHAALGVLTTAPAVTAKFTGIVPPAPTKAFEDAVTYLEKHHGKIDVRWGEINRLVRGGLNIPVDGAPDILRAIYSGGMREDGTMHAAAGDSWIALVEWDENGKVSADTIHNFGSNATNPGKPHYSDQAQMFASHKWRKALRSRAEIEATASRRYRPGR